MDDEHDGLDPDDYKHTIATIGTGLGALLRKCLRDPKIKRVIDDRRTLFFVVMQYTMNLLGIDPKAKLIKIVSEEIGFDEARQLIAEQEKEADDRNRIMAEHYSDLQESHPDV